MAFMSINLAFAPDIVSRGAELGDHGRSERPELYDLNAIPSRACDMIVGVNQRNLRSYIWRSRQ